MINLLMTLALTCPMSRIADKTGTWGKPEDLEAFRIAKVRCQEIYGEKAPCLKKFEKTGDRTYKATCGLE